jgi:hypothetical protein
MAMSRGDSPKELQGQHAFNGFTALPEFRSVGRSGFVGKVLSPTRNELLARTEIAEKSPNVSNQSSRNGPESRTGFVGKVRSPSRNDRLERLEMLPNFSQVFPRGRPRCMSPDTLGRLLSPKKKYSNQNGVQEKMFYEKMKIDKLVTKATTMFVANGKNEQPILSPLVDAKEDRRQRRRRFPTDSQRPNTVLSKPQLFTPPHFHQHAGTRPGTSSIAPNSTYFRMTPTTRLLGSQTEDDSPSKRRYDDDVVELTKMLLSLDQGTMEPDQSLYDKDGYQSFAIESEVKLTEALLPPPELKLDPTPKRTAICFELLHKLIRHTDRQGGYRKLSDRLLTEIANSIYASDPNGNERDYINAKVLLQDHESYFQKIDTYRHERDLFEEQVNNLQVIVTRQKLVNQKRASALTTSFARRQIDVLKRYFDDWKSEIRKGKQIVTKMMKKFKRIYFLGLRNNARQRKLTRMKELIKDLEDPLENRKRENEFNHYKSLAEKLTKELELALHDLKDKQEKLSQNERKMKLVTRKAENSACSLLLQPMFKTFELIREGRAKRLESIVLDDVYRSSDAVSTTNESQRGVENEKQQSDYENKVQRLFRQFKARLVICRQLAYENLIGDSINGVQTQGSSPAKGGWQPGLAIPGNTSDDASSIQHTTVLQGLKSEGKGGKKSQKLQKKMNLALVALATRKWTSVEIEIAANHANNESKSKNLEQTISPQMLESVASRVAAVEPDGRVSDAEIFSMFGPTHIDGASSLVDHLYADWANELEADDLNQMVPKDSFSTDRFKRTIHYTDMQDAIDHVNTYCDSDETKVTAELAAALLFATAESNLTRKNLIESFCNFPSHLEDTALQSNYKVVMEAILKRLDNSISAQVQKQSHWTRCRDLRPVLRGMLPEDTPICMKGGVAELSEYIREKDEAHIASKFPWIMEPAHHVSIGVDDVESLILGWVKLFTREKVENLGSSLRTSTPYGDLIKHLASQLFYLHGPRNGEVGEDNFEDAINVAMRNLDLNFRAEQILGEMQAKFMVPKELMKASEIVDGDSEWAFEVLAYLFTIVGTGLEPSPSLVEAEVNKLRELDDKYIALKIQAGETVPAEQHKIITKLHLVFEKMEVVERRLFDKIEGVREGHAMWHSACNHISKVVYENLSRRARGVESLVQIRNDMAQASVYSKLRPERLRDILVSGKSVKDKHKKLNEEEEEQVNNITEDVEKFLATNHSSLRTIYKAYAGQGGGGVAIKQEQFIKLCKDCKIPDKKFTEHMLPIVFIRSNYEAPGADTSAKKMAAVLNPSEYVEAIVRLAFAKYEGQSDPLVRKVRRLVDHHILPHAQRSDVDNFRRSMKTEEMHLVLKKHEPNLMSTFKKYAQAELSHKAASATFGDVHKDTINYSEFSVFMKDKKLIDGALSNNHVLTIFNNVQSEAEGASEDDLMALEMDYTEFCEAIVAIAAWKMPSPFMAFDQRVDTFLSMILFKDNDKKNKGGGKKKKGKN